MTQFSQKPAVLSVGRVYCDLIFTGVPRMPTLGTEIFTEGFGAHAGGGSFITAAHLAQLGHPSALAAMLPAPPFQDLMAADLAASGVDLSLCKALTPQDGPQITVALAKDADRSFVTRRAGAAFPRIEPKALTDHGIRHLHIGEIASLVEQPEVIEIAKALGVTVSADCGWDEDFDAGALTPFVGMIDVFLPNAAEMAVLEDSNVGSRLATVTVIKRGDQGATLLAADKTIAAPAFQTEVVDTTGAGDAFNAGFLSLWLTGAPFEACLEAGNKRGALAVQTRGGFSTG